MRILVAHNRYRSAAPSGENRVVDQEIEALQTLGHDVERFERQSDSIEDWSLLQKATLPGRVIWNPATKRDLSRALRRFKPDVVHVHNTFPLLSPSILYACRDERIPVVVTVHNYKMMCASGDFFRSGGVCHDCAHGALAPALVHRCYRGSAIATVPPVVAAHAHRRAWRNLVSAYVFVSESVRRLLAGMEFDPERVFVKHNLVPSASFSDHLAPANNGQRQVAYVGRLDEAKGIPLLLQAWDRYLAVTDGNPLRLVIAGSGPLERDVRAWAAGRSSVEIVGQLNKRACTELITQCRAVVLPSQWEETFGLVVVEAMAAGVAPIASAHGSFPELITNETDGVLFNAGDLDDLARVIKDVEKNDARYLEYGRHARATYERRHDPGRNMDQLVDIYKFAIAKPVIRREP